MFEIDEQNVVDYLRRHERLPAGANARAERLAWGVSNVVLRIHLDRGLDFVVKQSHERLRTQADWFSRLDRVYREVDVMKALAPLLPAGVIPSVLFELRDDYLYAMEAAPADHVVWKADLLAGKFEPEIAGTLGNYLATIHRETAGDETLRQKWRDRQVFDELRLDPFYRRIADVHSDIRVSIEQLIEETTRLQLCAVHGDFSPKNVLIANGKLMLVDFETGHFGDPAFDLGFFLSHLLLKTVLYAAQPEEVLELARRFWTRYQTGMAPLQAQGAFSEAELNRRAVAHTAACMLSRIDGKSPVDYLPRDDQKNLVRRFCIRCLLEPPENVAKMLHSLAIHVSQLGH